MARGGGGSKDIFLMNKSTGAGVCARGQMRGAIRCLSLLQCRPLRMESNLGALASIKVVGEQIIILHLNAAI
jgi:hypothetical protein